MNKENKQIQYGYTKTDNGLEPYMVNGKSEKSFALKHPVAVAALAAVAVGGGFELAKSVSQEHQVPSADHGVMVETPKTHESTDPHLDKRLVYWQATFDGDFKIAPTDIPPSAWQNGPHYAVTIHEGGGIETDALKKYEEMHHLSGDEQVPDSVKTSIHITAESFKERARAEGGNGIVHAGDILTLNELTDADNIERAIVSNGVVDETNK